MKIADAIINALEHNPEHYLEITIHGRKIRPCARCFGKYLGIISSFFISIPFILGYFSIDFKTSFILSWLLALPSIIDWATVKLGIWKGNNKIRFITGFLLGCGIVTYFLIMPASYLFKFSSFFLYEIAFATIYIHTKVGIKNAFNNFIKNIKYIKSRPLYSCTCGYSCCCPCAEGCYGGCMNACLCVTLACLSIPCCCLIGKSSIFGKKGGG